jgi:LPS export ABC transporter protein LptC
VETPLRKKKTPIPEEPALDFQDLEPPRARWKRYVWIFGTAAFLAALLAWGLHRSVPPPAAPEAVSQGEDSPDAVIEKFHLVSTVQGKKRWEFFADKARLYQDRKEAYTDDIYAEYFRNDKLTSTLTADKAVVNTETNATQAQGHVELIVANGSKLETDRLNWDPDTDLIKTEGWVHVYKGSDDITALGMVADTELNNIRFTKDVHTKVRDTNAIRNFSKPKPF